MDCLAAIRLFVRAVEFGSVSHRGAFDSDRSYTNNAAMQKRLAALTCLVLHCNVNHQGLSGSVTISFSRVR